LPETINCFTAREASTLALPAKVATQPPPHTH
jgi:hypothetical protein